MAREKNIQTRRLRRNHRSFLFQVKTTILGTQCCLHTVENFIVRWLFRLPSNEQSASDAHHFYAAVVAVLLGIRNYKIYDEHAAFHRDGHLARLLVP